MTWTNIDVVSLVGAVVGPFLAVLAAQALVRRDARRQSATEVFLRINKHVQDFRTAFLARHPENLPMHTPPGVTGPTIDLSKVRTLDRELLDVCTGLNGDCLMLGLIFGHDADKLGQKIHIIIDRANLLLDKDRGHQLPNYEVSKAGLDGDIKAATDEIKPLWASFERRPLCMHLRGWRASCRHPKSTARNRGATS